MRKPARLKTIFLFAFFACTPALFAVLAWIVSVNTIFFDSFGQIILGIIITVSLLLLTGQIFLNYLNKRFYNPLFWLTDFLGNISKKDLKPIPSSFQLYDFKVFYTGLLQIQNFLSHDLQTFSDFKQISEAQTALFETALSGVTDPVITLNLKYEVKFFSHAACDFTGIEKVNALGKRVDQILRIYDKQNKEIPYTLYTKISEGSPDSKIFFGSEFKIISSLNRQGSVDVTIFKPLSGETIDTSVVILLHDKTREKQLEAMKLDFVSMAAHELRTPLTSIKGYISVFINENQHKLTPEQLMFVRRINTSTQQLSGLVENLLSVARVERGAMSLNTQIVDWSSNVSAQVETFLHRAEEKRISLKFTPLTGAKVYVKIDLVRINEVLSNIISNAINYTEPQGNIEVWLENKGNFINTHIKDTGKGVPKEALPNLFSKFFRVSGGPAEEASKGNGLGLYLSKAIVGLHSGEIWAQSEGLGKGSTFSFSLPTIEDTIDVNTLTKSI